MELRGKIVVILGPTSSGKSGIAIKLAKKFNGEIISADSRQVYRHMNIGTGKITKKEMGGIKHYMIDIVSPKTNYNVAKFKKAVDKIIPEIIKRGKVPIICGGTGFWIKTIVDNVKFPKVKPNKELRNKLRNKSALQLFKELNKLDPERAKSIDKNNKVRLIRAIEIAEELGRVPTNNSRLTTYNFLQIGIVVSKDKLYQNIKKRLEARFKQGMIKEVKDLHDKYKLSWKKIQSFGLGYYWIPLYLQNKLSKKELFEKICQAEKDYAKRQMTWFRKDKRIKWVESYKEIEKEIKEFIL